LPDEENAEVPELENHSYLTLHVRLQRTIPTFNELRRFFHAFQSKEGKYPSLADTEAEFPECDIAIVRFMYNSMVATFRQEAWCELNYLSIPENWTAMNLPFVEDDDNLHSSSHSKNNRVHDLSHPLPPVRQGMKRRSESMSMMSLSYRARYGASIGIARGLHLLVKSYQERLLKYWKHEILTERQNKNSSTVIIDDADLEEKTEPLRISPALLNFVKDMHDLSKEDIQQKIWRFIENCMVVATRKLQHSSEEGCGHEDLIGVVGILLKKSNLPLQLWKPLYNSSKSFSKDTSVDLHNADGIANAILAFFGLVAFVEQTENWTSSPSNDPGHLYFVNYILKYIYIYINILNYIRLYINIYIYFFKNLILYYIISV